MLPESKVKPFVQTGIPLGWIQPRKEMFRRCPDGLLWESYPTDTAAFMGIRDMAGTSVAVCVDRYGELLLGMGQNGSYSYWFIKDKMSTVFKWLHVVLDLNNESVCLNRAEDECRGMAPELARW